MTTRTRKPKRPTLKTLQAELEATKLRLADERQKLMHAHYREERMALELDELRRKFKFLTDLLTPHTSLPERHDACDDVPF